MAITVRHATPAGAKVTRADYDADHVVIGSASGESLSLADYLDDDRIPFVTDDLEAFEALFAAASALSTGDSGIPTLHWPAGKYYCSDSINVHGKFRIIGGGSGNGVSGTLIRFAPDCNGIVFNYGNTHGDDEGAQGSSEGGSIEGVALYGGNVTVDGDGDVTSYGAGTSPTGHGIRIRAPFIRVADVACFFFGGDGFNINCTAGSGGVTEGNANSFYLERCAATYNGRYGYFTNGNDANAGTFNTCSAISNSGCGFLEYSFLGNSYIQCHARDNGYDDPLNLDAPVGTCTHGGLKYYVLAESLAAASTTEPGTDSTVWVESAGILATRAWVTGLEWTVGGGYATNPANSNARNVFVGCYAESGQSPVQATEPSLFLGGLLDEVGFVGTASWLRANAYGLANAKGFNVDGANATLRLGDDGGNRLVEHVIGATNIKIERNGTTHRRFEQNSQITEQWGHHDDASNLGPYHHYHYRLFKGSSDGNANNGQLDGCTTSLGDLETHLAGDTVQRGWRWTYINPSAGGAEGLVCVTAGVVGSTAAFEEFGRIGIVSDEWRLAGTGQTAAGVYDFAVDGAKANIEFAGLAGAKDIRIIAVGVTKAVSGFLKLVVSTDNGSTFYTTSGDYVTLPTTGISANAADANFHDPAATAARSGVLRIEGADVAGTPKIIEQMNNNDFSRMFVASTAAINAIRVFGSAGGNITGGKIYCLVR